MIYFDHAASTPINKEILQQMMISYGDDFANPASKHAFGQRLGKKLEDLRQKFKKKFFASDEWELIFTSSATESNNTVFYQIKEVEGLNLYSFADHMSIVNPLKHTDSQNFCLHHKTFSEQWPEDKKVKLLALSPVNNHSGKLVDFKDVCSEVKKRSPGTHIHLDAVQFVGKYDCSLKNADFDSLSFTSHKLAGPKGIAGLFIKKNALKRALLVGGGHEHGWRASTPSVTLIEGFYLAFEKKIKVLDESFEKVDKLRKLFFDLIREDDCPLIFPFTNRDEGNPYIITFIIPDIPSDMIMRHLELKQIYLSTSSACSSKTDKESETLKALGIESKYFKHVLRLSFSPENTEEEVRVLVKTLSHEIKELTQLIGKRK